MKQTKEAAFTHGRALMNNFQALTINESVLLHSFEISTNYQSSYWDSLIIATALPARVRSAFNRRSAAKFPIEKN